MPSNSLYLRLYHNVLEMRAHFGFENDWGVEHNRTIAHNGLIEEYNEFLAAKTAAQRLDALVDFFIFLSGAICCITNGNELRAQEAIEQTSYCKIFNDIREVHELKYLERISANNTITITIEKIFESQNWGTSRIAFMLYLFPLMLYLALNTDELRALQHDQLLEAIEVVHKSNMQKQRASTERGVYDLTKPEGWQHPTLNEILEPAQVWNVWNAQGTIDDLLQERQEQYGDYAEGCVVMQNVINALQTGSNWNNTTPGMRTAMQIIALKLSRVVTGNATHVDNWVDIQGYARCVQNELENPNVRRP